MKIKRLFLVLAVVVVCCIAAEPRVAQAVSDCRCLPAGGSTADYWGTGSSCTAAASDWKAKARAEEVADCMPYGVCSMTPPYVVNIACYWDEATQAYWENGEGRFRCQVCFD
jgi:hypothetical protein